MAAYPAIYAFAGAQFAPMGWLLALSIDGLPAGSRRSCRLLPAGGLVFTALLVARRPPAFIAHRRALPLALAGGLAFGLVFGVTTPPPRLGATRAASSATSGRSSERPNVIILAVDSMRADLLRDHPEAVPNLSALARRATVFTRAIPTVPRTYPSWASMLTGRGYPHRSRHPTHVPGAAPILERPCHRAWPARGAACPRLSYGGRVGLRGTCSAGATGGFESGSTPLTSRSPRTSRPAA